MIITNPHKTANHYKTMKNVTETLPEITTQVEYITPEKAEKYLKANTMNRAVSTRLVNAIASDILGGRWEFNGEPIIFNGGNILLDGQHRLIAIVKAGVAVPCLVVRGVEEDARTTVDTGRSRTASDVLSMHGFKYASSLSRAGKILVGAKKIGKLTTATLGGAYISNHEVLKFCQLRRDRLEELGAYCHGFRLATVGAMVGILYAAIAIDENLGREFGRQLIEGQNPSPFVRYLRESKLIPALGARRYQKAYIETATKNYLVVAAWNALYLKREPLTKYGQYWSAQLNNLEMEGFSRELI